MRAWPTPSNVISVVAIVDGPEVVELVESTADTVSFAAFRELSRPHPMATQIPTTHTVCVFISRRA